MNETNEINVDVLNKMKDLAKTVYETHSDYLTHQKSLKNNMNLRYGSLGKVKFDDIDRKHYYETLAEFDKKIEDIKESLTNFSTYFSVMLSEAKKLNWKKGIAIAHGYELDTNYIIPSQSYWRIIAPKRVDENVSWFEMRHPVVNKGLSGVYAEWMGPVNIPEAINE